jgi:hypothetical protein
MTLREAVGEGGVCRAEGAGNRLAVGCGVDRGTVDRGIDDGGFVDPSGWQSPGERLYA